MTTRGQAEHLKIVQAAFRCLESLAGENDLFVMAEGATAPETLRQKDREGQ